MEKMNRAVLVAGAIVAAAAVTVATFAGGGLPWFGGLGGRPIAPPQTTGPGGGDYKKIAKWAVSYADRNLGLVEGKATCRWQSLTVHTGGTSRAELPVECQLKVRNPRTGQLHILSAPAYEIRLPDKNNATLRITLHGQLPGERISQPPSPPLSLSGAPGGTATIRIKNGTTESSDNVDISAAALADPEQVRLVFDRDPNGAWFGEWRYTADPLTERNAEGTGPVGAFETLRDEDTGSYAPRRPGGFLGLQKGRMDWRPLPPTIYTVHVLEDQAEFAGVGLAYRYPYPNRESGNPGSNAREASTRTLVIIGRDLPMLDNDPVFEIESKDPRLHYWIVANVRAKGLPPEYRLQFEKAWHEATLGWEEGEAREFRRLDAVLVRVTIGDAFATATDPGPKMFTWGTARAAWTLQYGDNTAEVTFTRLIGAGPAPGTSGSAQRAAGAGSPREEYETVAALAGPEKVFVEVRTGTQLPGSTIPVIVGTDGAQGPVRLALTASRVPGDETLYRTPPIVVTGINQGRGLSTGGVSVVETGSHHLLAAVDPEQAHFLRATPAEAAPGDARWTTRLHEVLRCLHTNRGITLDDVERDWPGLARRSEGIVSGVDVRYGDHAAMLLLRDAFVQAQDAQIAMLRSALAEEIPRDQSDGLVDAWYRSVAPAVTEIPDYPLATFTVASPAGAVPFKQAYSDEFREVTFHPATTPDGQTRFIAWRRQASREALKFALQRMTDAANRARAIGSDEYGRCDYKELLKFTGSGFHHVAARVSPLLMKPGPGGLAEPDRLARAYTQNLDTLAGAVEAQKALASAEHDVIAAAASLIVPPLAGVAWGVFGSGAAAVSAWTSVVGGLTQWSYESAHKLYDTYQGHEEVRFAFGAYAVLGLDRYFDAVARAQSWWQTSLSIAGSIGLQMVQGHVLQKAGKVVEKYVPNVVVELYPSGYAVSEEIALWRGSRAAADLPSEATLDAARRLKVSQKGEVLLYLAKMRQQLLEVKVAGGEAAHAARVFDALEREVAGAPVLPEEPVVAALERQAARPVADPAAQPGAADALRAVKQEVAAGDALGEARAARAESDAEVAAVAGEPRRGALGPQAHPRIVELGVSKPTELPVLPEGMPVPNTALETTVKFAGADRVVKFDLGNVISHDSVFFVVYELKSPETIPQDILAQIRNQLGLRGSDEPLVIKILNKNGEKLRKLVEGEPDATAPLPGIDDHVVARLLRAQDHLRAKGIPQQRIAGFDEAGIVIQKKFTTRPGEFELMRYEDRLTDPGKAEAFLALMKQLFDADLGWLDAGFGNIYFERQGGKWICGVLDQDFVGTYEELTSGVYGAFLDGQKGDGSIKSFLNPASGKITDVRSLMYKMFEAKAWVKYSLAEKRLVSHRLTVEELKKVFPEMPFLDQPAPPAKRSGGGPFDPQLFRAAIATGDAHGRGTRDSLPRMAA